MGIGLRGNRPKWESAYAGIGLTKREPKPTGLALLLGGAAAAAAVRRAPMRCAALQVLHIAADGASLDEVRALRLVVPRVSTHSTV